MTANGRLPDRETQGWVATQASERNVDPIVLIGRLKPGQAAVAHDAGKGAPSVDQQVQDWG